MPKFAALASLIVLVLGVIYGVFAFAPLLRFAAANKALWLLLGGLATVAAALMELISVWVKTAPAAPGDPRAALTKDEWWSLAGKLIAASAIIMTILGSAEDLANSKVNPQTKVITSN